jgi:hypothetical protein
VVLLACWDLLRSSCKISGCDVFISIAGLSMDNMGGSVFGVMRHMNTKFSTMMLVEKIR